MLLPKKAYSKVLQGLKKMHESWLEDRKENPNLAPYEIDSSLKMLIERVIREEHVHCHGNSNKDILVTKVIEYLVEKGHIIGSPYGGVFFPLPDGHGPIPTKEELIENTKETIKKLGL